MDSRNQSDQKSNSESSASQASSSSSKPAKVYSIKSDSGLNFFITTAKTDKEKQESMLSMLRVNHLLSSSPSAGTIPSEQDANFILNNPNIDLRTRAPGLFRNVKSINQTACNILNEKTLPLFSGSAPEWKYNEPLAKFRRL